MPRHPWSPRPALEKAAAELRANPLRSDREIARAAGVHRGTVSLARHKLEAMFLIGVVPISQRGRTGPSPVRDAIIARPGATARQIADEAHVAYKSAWLMLRKDRAAGNRRTADVAAAVDTISVIRIIPRPCAFCRRPHVFADGRSRYCSPECAAAADLDRKSRYQLDRGIERPNLADPDHRPPQHWQMPPPPDWSKGTCTLVKPAQRAWWSSEVRSERQAAQLMCAGCEVRAECEAWSLNLPLSDDSTIYAGLTRLSAAGSAGSCCWPSPPR